MSANLGRPVCIAMALALAAAVSGCRGLTAPSCRDESGSVLQVNGEVEPESTRIFTVVSPKHSNLTMRLTWPDAAAVLDIQATITACGEHAGCQMFTAKPAFGPGGSSPVPQPWPPGLREMLVDGTRGKTYRIEIVGDPTRLAAFTLDVRYLISCES